LSDELVQIPSHGEAPTTVWVRASRVDAVKETVYVNQGPMTTVHLRGGASFTSTASGQEIVDLIEGNLA